MPTRRSPRRHRNPSENYEEYHLALEGSFADPSAYLFWYFPDTGLESALIWRPARDREAMEFVIGAGRRGSDGMPFIHHQRSEAKFPAPQPGAPIGLSDRVLRAIGMEGYFLLPEMVDRMYRLYPSPARMVERGIQRSR